MVARQIFSAGMPTSQRNHSPLTPSGSCDIFWKSLLDRSHISYTAKVKTMDKTCELHSMWLTYRLGESFRRRRSYVKRGVNFIRFFPHEQHNCKRYVIYSQSVY